MMNRVWAICKREFMSYFNSLMAYFFLVVFLGVINMLFIRVQFFYSRTTVMSQYFEFMCIGLWLFIPAITMRAWAEERNLGTFELLMTMPVRYVEAVLGKFLACWGFLALTLLLSFLTIPMALAYVGDVDWGPVIGGYLGLFLLGGLFIAIGLSQSLWTKNQFIAFLLTSIVCLLFLGIAELYQYIGLSGWALKVVAFIDAGSHFDSIMRGVIDTRDVVYYLSFTIFGLFGNYLGVLNPKLK